MLLTTVIFLSNPVETNAQVNKQDSLALVDLYNNTNGPEWNNHKNWLKGPVKNWYGITIENKRVTKISLYSNNLKGVIPSSLSNLQYLSILYVPVNQLNGSIPVQLSNLSNLGQLSLGQNQLSGNIPPELGSLSNLYYLDLSENQLSGNIPPQLSKLSSLAYLYLHKNQLSGNISPELGKLTNLVSLLSYNNQLSGHIPYELGNLSNLTVLALDSNHLSGNIPPELGKLSSLKFLYLFNNQLSGNIPLELGQLPNLRYLYLNSNKLGGLIPASIANLDYLAALDLSNNRFTFDGMELIAKKFPFAKYGRQANIPLYLNNNTLSVSAGGKLSNNTYVWYRKGAPGNTTIKGDSVFHPTESGVYFVKVRNKIATGLKLVSRAVKYTAPPSSDVVVSNKLPEVLNNSFSVYPNPAKDILQVRTVSNVSVSLLSQGGEVLLTENINRAGSIDISNIAAGVYYLRDNTTNAVRKIVITR